MKPRVTRSGAYTSTKVGEVFVVVGTNTVDDSEWLEHCENLRDLASLPPKPRALLLYAAGTGPTTKQRKILATEYHDAVGGVRAAVLTDSMIARGVMTALGWLLASNTKAFELDELEAALKWLATQVPIEAQRVREALAEAQRVSRESRPRVSARAR